MSRPYTKEEADEIVRQNAIKAAASAPYENAVAQCRYEVAGNPMTLQGGWLYQAAVTNQLFDLCMRAKLNYAPLPEPKPGR